MMVEKHDERRHQHQEQRAGGGSVFRSGRRVVVSRGVVWQQYRRRTCWTCVLMCYCLSPPRNMDRNLCQYSRPIASAPTIPAITA